MKVLNITDDITKDLTNLCLLIQKVHLTFKQRLWTQALGLNTGVVNHKKILLRMGSGAVIFCDTNNPITH